MHARRAGLACVLVALLAAGCSPADGTAPPMSDPLEILEEALSSTASLSTVHARVELGATGGQSGLDGLAADGDLDLGELELSATVELPLALGGARLSVIYADRELFTRPGSGAWARVGGNGEADPLVFVPTVAKIADALDMALEEPGVRATLVDTEECGVASCYRVAVEVPPEAVWLTALRLQGLDGLDPPMPGGIPALAVEAWIERAELRLVGFRGAIVDAGGGSLLLEVVLSAHDAPVDVSPPPSDEVAPGD